MGSKVFSMADHSMQHCLEIFRREIELLEEDVDIYLPLQQQFLLLGRFYSLFNLLCILLHPDIEICFAFVCHSEWEDVSSNPEISNSLLSNKE